MRIRERLRGLTGRVAVWARGTAEALEDKAKLLRLEAAEKRLARREGPLEIRFTGAAPTIQLALPVKRSYELRVDARTLLPALIERVRERVATKSFHGGVWNCAGGVGNLADLCAAAKGPELAIAEADFPDFPMGLPSNSVRSFVCPVCGERPGSEIRSEASDAPGGIGTGMGWAIHCSAGHLLVRSGRMGS